MSEEMGEDVNLSTDDQRVSELRRIFYLLVSALFLHALQ